PPRPPPGPPLFPYTTLFRSAAVDAIEALGQPRQVFRRDAGAGVVHGHRIPARLRRPHIYFHEAAGGRVAHRIAHEVGERALPLRSEEHTSELQSRSDLVCRL